jgi:hypothetical protein
MLGGVTKLSFNNTLVELRNGGVAIDMEKGLEQVVAAVRQTGKGGKLTMTLLVKPADKGPDIDTVFIVDQIKVEAPEADKKVTLFFANEANQLSRSDNRQSGLFESLREVEQGEGR